MQKFQANDASLRIATVGKQREIEDKLSQGSAIFVVQDRLTPLFIPSEAVMLDNSDELYKLKEAYKASIPDGLIPVSKSDDPKQLSTVLGRVLSLHTMLDSGVNITVIHVNTERPKAEEKPGFVDATNIIALQKTYPNLQFHIISQETYNHYRTKVCAATYCDEHTDEKIFTGIDASQVHTTTSHHDWGVKVDQSVSDKITSLNELLTDCKLEPILSSSNYTI